jgi:ABC-type branched-subunit amino acid transport system ATPase component
MSEPKLILLDEPSMGLAPVIVAQVFDLYGASAAKATRC